MLETILKLYYMAMAGDVRSPVPHLFGPPGCGKSSVIHEAAQVITAAKRAADPDAPECKVHTINVSRISPLELEGVQMPVSTADEAMALQLLHATWWTQLKDDDILFLDELLRGFPEVYNGLLDILTSREVGGFKLPKVFIVAASNSTVAYDKALEDRLLHIKVPDPRKRKGTKKAIATRLTDTLGLLPLMADSMEMETLLNTQILPTYRILDEIGGKVGGVSTALEGKSIRNLIGQVQLRHVETTELQELIDTNNGRAMNVGKPQFVVLTSPKKVDPKYRKQAEALVGNDRLSPVQELNLRLNLQLLDMAAAQTQKGVTADDDADVDVDLDDIFS